MEGPPSKRLKRNENIFHPQPLRCCGGFTRAKTSPPPSVIYDIT